ncbi:MAG: beta-lactamase family protein [Gemmataceae bacterium]|nr:beta-lactamase family protein [Gemmataceae bacterium]
MLPLGLFLAAAAAPPDPVTPPADFAARAEAYMAAQAAVNDFSGVVLVAVDGRPVFRRACGFANRDWDIPNTPDTKFRIASVTKQFTSAAILLLEQQGKLSVSDPVGKHLSDVPVAWADVTLLQLMSHTGGIPNAQPAVALAPGGLARHYRPRQVIDLVKDKPLEFPPGEKWVYSNTGYVLLGMVIEAVGGKDYPRFMREAVLDPLGMADTGVERPRQILRNRATGYVRAGDRVTAPYLSMSWPHAAGAMYSTADDLLRWDRVLAGDRLLGPAARKTMFAPGQGRVRLRGGGRGGVRPADRLAQRPGPRGPGPPAPVPGRRPVRGGPDQPRLEPTRADRVRPGRDRPGREVRPAPAPRPAAPADKGPVGWADARRRRGEAHAGPPSHHRGPRRAGGPARPTLRNPCPDCPPARPSLR